MDRSIGVVFDRSLKTGAIAVQLTCMIEIASPSIHPKPPQMAKQRATSDKESKTFRLDSKTLRDVEELAQAHNRTLNNMVETILKKTVATTSKELAL